jgi:large-conductance mechanosensitive channel
MQSKLKKYIIKSALITSIIIWAIGSHLKDFTNILSESIITPFLEVDINNDGESDIHQILEWKLNYGNLSFPIGQIIKAILELLFKIILIYGTFLLIFNYTEFIK